jgi:hypothetical protein
MGQDKGPSECAGMWVASIQEGFCVRVCGSRLVEMGQRRHQVMGKNLVVKGMDVRNRLGGRKGHRCRAR